MQLPIAEVASAIKAGLDIGRDPALGSLSLAERKQLTELYETESYVPLWVDAAGRPSASARDALTLLGSAAADGLDAADYRFTQLEGLAAALGATAPPLAQAITSFELGLSGGMLSCILGKGTRAALRVPLTWRLRQIELGLERLRWLPHLGDDRLVAVNIPMFHLWVWDSIPPGGAPLFGMDVIVGRALNTRTPVFVDEMRYLVFRPYWNAPLGILRSEILPAIERDPDFLRQRDMEIVQGPGDNAQPVAATAENVALLRRGLLRVRQRPGPNNAMGLVKFMFPNDAHVYMHDTPAQELFSRTRRDFSRGCIRLEDPVAFAEWALKDQPGWTRTRILAAMNGSQPRRVNLARPIQVILFYITAAMMPEDGTLRFAEDIYDHDVRLDRALVSRRSRP